MMRESCALAGLTDSGQVMVVSPATHAGLTRQGVCLPVVLGCPATPQQQVGCELGSFRATVESFWRAAGALAQQYCSCDVMLVFDQRIDVKT